MKNNHKDTQIDTTKLKEQYDQAWKKLEESNETCLNEIDSLECSLKFYKTLVDQSNSVTYRSLMKQFCRKRESAEQCAARIVAKAYRAIIKDNTSSDPELICALYHVDELEKNWQNYHDLAFIKNSINKYRHLHEHGSEAALRIIIKAYHLALGIFVVPNKVI